MDRKIIVGVIALTALIIIFYLAPIIYSQATEEKYDFETVTLNSDNAQNFYDSITFNYDLVEYKSYLRNKKKIDSITIKLETSQNWSSMSQRALTSEPTSYWAYAKDNSMKSRLVIGQLTKNSRSYQLGDTMLNNSAYFSGVFYDDDNINIGSAQLNLFTRLFTSKSQQEKVWRRLLKDCMKTEQDKRQSYFGVSSFALGTLISKKTRKPTMILKDIISEAEYKKLINLQPNGSCNQSLITGTEFSGAFEAGAALVDAELMAEIIRSKKTTVIPGNYHNTFLLVPALKKLLKNATTQDLLDYKKELFSDENYIILSTKTISGYRADIEIESTNSAALKSKLDSGIVYQIDELGAELKYKRVSDNKISASSTEKFVPFGEFGKLKKK
jgi:hypothetical protein